MDNITAPVLPSRLPAMNERTRRSGVDVDTICGGNRQHADDYFCPICMGFPRFPASLKCGHVGCEECLRKMTILAPTTDFNLPIGAAACPQCRTTFVTSDVLPYQCWPLPAKTVYRTIIIQCSFPSEGCDGLGEGETKCKRCKVLEQCEFKGTMEQLVIHEMYECPNRFISCPSPNCHRYGRARDIAADHFPICPSLRINCPTCGLPILYSKRSLHNCIADLQKTIKKLYRNAQLFRTPVKRIWLPGKPGEICQFSESDDGDPEASSSSQQPLASTPTTLGDTVARAIGDWRPASWRTPSATTSNTATTD